MRVAIARTFAVSIPGARRALSLLVALALLVTAAPLVMVPEAAVAALPTATLNAVTFIPGTSNVIAVGASGTILRSADSGATWTVVRSGGSYDFRGVTFVDQSRGWAMTRFGGVFTSTDGGLTWGGPQYYETETLIPTGLANDVAYTLSPGSAVTGYAAGGRVSTIAGQDKPHAWTSSGTNQWTQGWSYDPYVNPATGDYAEVYRNGTGELYSIDFPSSVRGYAVGHDRFYQWWSPATQHNKALIGIYNSSASPVWQWKALAQGTGALYGVSFADNSRGIAVGPAGKVFYTSDGWNIVGQTSTGTADLNAVAMSGISKAWAVASNGTVARTTNGGANWTATTVAAGVKLNDVATPGGGSESAVVVGQSGRIVYTTNGTTWYNAGEAPPPTGTILIDAGATATSSRNVALSHTADFKIGGTGQMRHSTNAGVSWTVWEPYATAKAIVLPEGEGTKSVRVQFMNSARTVSTAVIEDTIILDTTPPTGGVSINSGAAATASTAVTLDNAVDFAISGPHPAQGMCFSLDGGSNWTGWEPYQASKNITLPAGSGTKTVTAQFKDAAGNFAHFSDSIILDQTVPTGSMTINGGAAVTTSAGVTVTHSPVWGPSGAGRMRHSVDEGVTWTVWQPYSATKAITLPGEDGTKTVRVEFEGAVGNRSVTEIGASILLQTTVPSGTIELNGGSPYTNSTSVTVSSAVNWSVGAPGEMRFSTNGGSTWGGWVLYAEAADLTLPTGDGLKTVRAQFKDAGEIESVEVIEATITLDRTEPSASITIDDGKTATNSTAVTVVSTVNFAISGPHASEAMRFSANGGSTWTGWEPYAATKNLLLAGGDGTKTVMAQFRDGAGNVGSASKTIKLDTTPPTGSIAIAGGKAATNTTSVTVNNSVNFDVAGADAAEAMRFSVDGGTSWSTWQPYAATRTVTLPSGEGTKAVIGEFQDAAGNRATFSDTIILDTTKPTGAITINNNATHTLVRTVTVTSSMMNWGLSGAGQMRFSINGGSWSTQEPYKTTKSLTLATGDGTKTVRAEFTDAAGNASTATISDSIYFGPIEIKGDTRYHTAIETAKRAFPAGASTVIIATGNNFPDALAAAPLAGALDAPILLVPTKLPAAGTSTARGLNDTLSYIKNTLKPTEVIVLGGDLAITPAVRSRISSTLTGVKITRIAGDTRYLTANMIIDRARTEMSKAGTPMGGTAFLATGTNFPDALAAAPVSVSTGRPVYLTSTTSFTPATRDAMKKAGVTKVIVLGGELAINATAYNQVRTAFGASNVRRIWGDTRYETAAKIATEAVNLNGHTWDRVGITTGTNFPDALAGGVLQGKQSRVVLLTRSDALSADTRTTLVAQKAKIQTVTFFGGDIALNPSVRTAVRNALQ